MSAPLDLDSVERLLDECGANYTRALVAELRQTRAERRKWQQEAHFATEGSKELIENACATRDAALATLAECDAEIARLKTALSSIYAVPDDEAARRRGFKQGIEAATQAIQDCSSLDENGYICTKDDAIKALRDVLTPPPEETPQ
jgi:hypothetical protein